MEDRVQHQSAPIIFFHIDFRDTEPLGSSQNCIFENLCIFMQVQSIEPSIFQPLAGCPGLCPDHRLSMDSGSGPTVPDPCPQTDFPIMPPGAPGSGADSRGRNGQSAAAPSFSGMPGRSLSVLQRFFYPDPG